MISHLPNSDKRLNYLIVLFVLGLTFFYDLRLSLNRGLVITDDIFASDLMNDRYPVRVELARTLQYGNIPLWTPHIYTGFPLQANPESGITYPLNLVLFKLLSPPLALNISILIKFFLAAIFLFLYLRLLNINPMASLFGGIAFSWCGFFVVHLKHVNMHDAGIWIPLMLVFFEKYRKERQPFWPLMISLTLGLQILAGHPQISYYTILFLILYFLYQELRVRLPASKLLRSLGYVVLAVVLGIGIGMVQTLPGMELAGLSERGGGVSFKFAIQHQYYLPDLLTFFYPYVNGDPGHGTYVGPGIFWEDYGYIGLLPLFFAVFAILRTFKRNCHTRFFAFALLVSIILMLGNQAVLYKILFYLVPGMNYFRFATRFILFADLSLCVLAGIGLAEALKKRGYLPYILVIGLTICDLFCMQKRQNPVVARSRWEKIPATAALIKQDTTIFRILSIGGVESHKTAYARARGWEGDLTPYVQQRAVLQASSNMLYGISSADGYINLVPKHLIKMWGNEKQGGLVHQTGYLSQDGQKLVLTGAFINVAKAFNIKYLVSIWPVENPDLELVYDDHGVWVYRNRKVMPRGYLVAGARNLDADEAASALINGRIDLARQVIINDRTVVETAADTGSAETGTALTREYTADHAVFKIDAQHDGWFVLADTYYPGWKAVVDAKEVKIYQANICARALPIKKGIHEIVYRYQPEAYRTGKIITLISTLIAVLGIVLSIARLRGKPSDREQN